MALFTRLTTEIARAVRPEQPVKVPRPTSTPAHEPHLVLDPLCGVPVMCCAAHDETAFVVAGERRPDHPDDPSWSPAKASYLRERLGW